MSYLYTIKNKKDEIKDLWIMDKEEPKKADYIFSVRFSRYVKPKSPSIYGLINEEILKQLRGKEE